MVEETIVEREPSRLFFVGGVTEVHWDRAFGALLAGWSDRSALGKSVWVNGEVLE